jgi:hypothetical protein
MGMAQIVPDPNRFLYHGTLRRNLPSIRNNGLQPQRGVWAARFHPDATALVYAVDDEHRSAAILAVGGQMAKAGLIRASENYSFDDFKNDLIEHGAVIIVKATTFRGHPWTLDSRHPTGAEPGNWYSLEPVSVQSEMIGEEMLAWLKPGEQDFIYGWRDHLQK